MMHKSKAMLFSLGLVCMVSCAMHNDKKIELVKQRAALQESSHRSAAISIEPNNKLLSSAEVMKRAMIELDYGRYPFSPNSPYFPEDGPSSEERGFGDFFYGNESPQGRERQQR